MLDKLNGGYTLYLGLCDENDNSEVIASAKKLHTDTNINFYQNYGADIAPFLSQLALIEEPFFIKLHSKKSYLGIYNQVNWRSVLVHSLIGSRTILNQNLNKILNNDNIGLISSKELIFTNKERNNSPFIDKLCQTLNIPYARIKNSEFVAGSMFMSRTELFKNIFTLEKTNLILDLLKYEQGKIDDTYFGTFSHALERIFSYIVKYKNLLIDYPDLDKKFILNTQFKNGVGRLIKLYNNNCYIEDHLDIFGKFLNDTKDCFEIEWHHMSSPATQKYKFLSKDTVIKSDNYLDYIRTHQPTHTKSLYLEIIAFIKNEEILIKQFLDHHLKIVDKITLIDNGSTDNTLDIIHKYLNNDKINFIQYNGPFQDKAKICTKIMLNSQSDLLIPLDADELIIYDDGLSLSTNAQYIRQYLQSINPLEQKYRIRRVYNKHPEDNDYFEVYKTDLNKIIFVKSSFVETDTGFHHGTTLNNKNPNETHTLDISYLHYKYVSKEKWINSTKAKLYARLGDKYNNLDEVKKYISYGSPESNYAAGEWIRFVENGVWCDIKKDIPIKISIDSVV